MHAVLRLVEHRGTREQTWELIAHLSDEATARLARARDGQARFSVWWIVGEIGTRSGC